MAKITATSAIQEAIERWTNRGYTVLPVAPLQDPHRYPKKDKQGNVVYEVDGATPKPLFNGKCPSFLDRNGKPRMVDHKRYQDRKPSSREMVQWWEHSETGVGILCSDKLPWLDPDRKNFESDEACKQYMKSLGIPGGVYIEKSPRGGYHIPVKLNCEKSFTNFDKGEFLGAGRFVVVAPTSGYEVVNDGEPWEINSLDELPIKPSKSVNAVDIKTEISHTDPVVYNPGQPIEMLKCCTKPTQEAFSSAPPSGDRSRDFAKFAREVYGWENWLTQNNVLFNGSADALVSELAEHWGIADKLDRMLKSISRHDCQPYLIRHGESSCKDRVDRLIKYTYQAQSTGGVGDEDGEADKVSQKTRAAYSIMQSWDLRFNRLTKEIELEGEPMDDSIYLKLQLEHGIGTAKDATFDLAVKIARQNEYSPVVEYLEGCYEKYGSDTSIFDGLITRLFGLDETPENEIYKTFFRKWTISAVARAFKPGCKVDTSLILQGDQGAKKSSLFLELASSQWFDDSIGSMTDKDERLKLHRAWILEWAELETVFKRKDVSAVKAFLTSRVDNVRPPYGRKIEAMARSSVIVGSTNEEDFLSDSTGNRRYWPIPVKKGHTIPIEWVKENRDRIWAAAVALYNAGEIWWLSDDEEVQAGDVTRRYQSEDAWTDTICNWLENHDKSDTTTSEILTKALNIDVQHQDKKAQMRVTAILKSLGWNLKRTTRSGVSTRLWRKPECEPIDVQSAPSQPDPKHEMELDWHGYQSGDPIRQRMSTGAWQNGRTFVSPISAREALIEVPSGAKVSLPWTDIDKCEQPTEIESKQTNQSSLATSPTDIKFRDEVFYVGSNQKFRATCGKSSGNVLVVKGFNKDGFAILESPDPSLQKNIDYPALCNVLSLEKCYAAVDY